MSDAPRGLSRRAALLLAAGSLAQLSLPRAAPRQAPVAAASAGAEQLDALLAEHARALRSGELAGLPLAALDYRVTGVDGSQLSADLSYRFQGFDDFPTVLQRRFTLGPDGRPTAETALAGSAIAPWDLGPARAVHGAHCLVLGPADQNELIALAQVADRAVPSVSALWGPAGRASWSSNCLPPSSSSLGCSGSRRTPTRT